MGFRVGDLGFLVSGFGEGHEHHKEPHHKGFRILNIRTHVFRDFDLKCNRGLGLGESMNMTSSLESLGFGVQFTHSLS